MHPDGRRAYIGCEDDVTRNGELIMSHAKCFKSCAIRSWTGGVKVLSRALCHHSPLCTRPMCSAVNSLVQTAAILRACQSQLCT